MVGSQSPKAPRMRHARKSIAHLPSQDVGGDKENATIDSTSFELMSRGTKNAAKKSRSKSLGPGGIDALKETTGNHGTPIRSILKPSMHLSPPKSTAARSPTKTSPNKIEAQSTPQGSPTKSPRKSPAKRAMSAQEDPFRSPKRSKTPSESPSRSPARVALRTEEEQQAQAREKEQQEIQLRREARRKSLATRRVSFAPEATLHTWDVVEMPEDSTTSSASTNSTRRSSAMTANQGSPFKGPSSPHPSLDGSEPPSTPPEQVDEIQVTRSPTHQRDLHQKKRRRSSTIPPVNFGQQEEFSSSPSSGDSVDDTSMQAFETADEGSDSSEDDKDLVEDETVTNVDGDDNTFHSADSTASSGRLTAALQQAAKQAGTKGIDFDEHGDLTMEMADDEVTEAFKPWVSSSKEKNEVGHPSPLLDQENVNPFSPAFKANVVKQMRDDIEDDTMDMTQAVGSILPTSEVKDFEPMQEDYEDNTMEMTQAVGGIVSHPEATINSQTEDENEDITMEMTQAIGSVLPVAKADEIDQIDGGDNDTMDITQAVGGILQNDDNTMEMTQAVGGILPALKADTIKQTLQQSEDNTMDMTQAVGSIISTNNAVKSPRNKRRKSIAAPRRRSGVTRRRSSVEAPAVDGLNGPSPDEDNTMEVTQAIGSILPANNAVKSPLKSPLKTPTKTPTKSPLKSPLKSLSKASTKSPMKSPAKSPINKRLKSDAISVQQNSMSRRKSSGAPSPGPGDQKSLLMSENSKVDTAQATGNILPSINAVDSPSKRHRESIATLGRRSSVTRRRSSGEASSLEDRNDQIHLQDFLNMTGIRFMELNTTKRRQTVAPNNMQHGLRSAQEGSTSEETDSVNDFESCVVASACTIPMLELYQHSCGELKSYISEGRKVAKEIEEATFEDNPPLFSEYMLAPADVKSIMDNQFKNVKTNARLLSKAMWYEWRMKLLDGLKEGLTVIGHGMEQDDRQLTQQEQILQPLIPSLTDEHERLTDQVSKAEAQAEELAKSDQEGLKEARNELFSIDQELDTKRQMVEDLQNQLRERENGLEAAVAAKDECVLAIKEAEQICQDCRGWSTDEVAALQASIRKLEVETGWTVSGATQEACTLTYEKSMELRFSPSAFLSNGEESKTSGKENAPINLTYVADTTEYRAAPLTTEKRFFLQIIRAQLQCLQQSKTKIEDLLCFVSSSWRTAVSVAEEIKALDIGYIADAAITGDESMAVRSIIFLKAMQTKVEATFDLRVQSREGTSGLSLTTRATVRVCYGETLNEKKMSEFLESRIKGAEGYGAWVHAARELEEKLISRGKKS